MGERDGSSSSLIPWYPLYRDFRYTVVFHGIRYTRVFVIPGCSSYCGILYTGVFVILQYSLYRVVTHTVMILVTMVFVISRGFTVFSFGCNQC